MPDSPQPASSLTQEILLNRMTNRIRQSLELQEILAATVAEMRSFLETDRVKVYRFQPDGTGEVIAESIHQQRLPALLNLRFPASDIPPHAREMFVKARQRSIVSVPDQQIILSRIDCSETTADLTPEQVTSEAIANILRRPVDPCHVQYLTAMGVQSSLVVPILHQQQLWGLLVSHHAEPKAFSEQQLQIVQIVADQVSIAIAQSHLLSQARDKAQREALINQISTLLHAPLRIQEILQIVLEKIVSATQSSGGRLYLMEGSIAGDLYTCALQPDTSATHQWVLPEDALLWQQLRHSSSAEGMQIKAVDDIEQEPLLSDLLPAFRSATIRSLMVMPLWYGETCLGYLTLFRNEVETDIVWAGRSDGDQRNDRVRDSFAAWRELKQGQAQPWAQAEIELVRSLGMHLAMAVMQQRLYQCEREQRLLVEMRNQELNTARTAAEEASRLKSDFLSSTSHELRTPLASLLNYLKLLREGFYDNEAELQEYIGVAYQSAENLVAIINDVLDIAKIEAGRMNVHLEHLLLAPILEEQRSLFRPESRNKAIALTIESAVDWVYGDRVKLRQILSNLLSNAYKFTQTGEVRVRCVERWLDERPYTEISVQDTGIGIDAANSDLLFEPFVQADGSIKRRYGGTGLGLTICKRLAELMNGKIRLESPGRGQGTTVTLVLPSIPLPDSVEQG